MTFVRFSVFTKIERNTAIHEVRQAVFRCKGWIADQTLFSNIAATINFEMPSSSVARFQEELIALDMAPHVEGELPTEDEGDVRGSVSLTFSHNEPDLKRDVPPFG